MAWDWESLQFSALSPTSLARSSPDFAMCFIVTHIWSEIWSFLPPPKWRHKIIKKIDNFALIMTSRKLTVTFGTESWNLAEYPSQIGLVLVDRSLQQAAMLTNEQTNYWTNQQARLITIHPDLGNYICSGVWKCGLITTAAAGQWPQLLRTAGQRLVVSLGCS